MSDDIVRSLERLMCSKEACGDMRIYMAAKLAAAEIQRLRAERDEARREVCLLRASTTSAVSIYGYAAERGWEEIFADDPEHERDA
jgi:hypothetical protein